VSKSYFSGQKNAKIHLQKKRKVDYNICSMARATLVDIIIMGEIKNNGKIPLKN
jgi:hypothetical protein